MIYIYLYVHGGERFLLLLPSAAQSGHIEYKKGGRKARGWGELPAGSREPPAASFHPPGWVAGTRGCPRPPVSLPVYSRFHHSGARCEEGPGRVILGGAAGSRE